MSSQKPVPIPWSQRADDLRRGPLTLLLWCAAAAGAGTLLIRQDERVQILGVAQSLEAAISSDVDGRIAEVLVQPFEDVTAGQVIARLDDARVAAEIETARAGVAALESAIDAGRARLAQELAQAGADRGAELRRFLLDEEEPRTERLQRTVQMEADRVERARIELRLKRAEELVARGLLPEAERDDLALRRDGLTAAIEATRAHVSALEKSEQAAIARRLAFEAEQPDALGADAELAPLRAQVLAASLSIEELRVARRALTLTTPLAGRVRQILAGTGQALLAGEPVATITGVHADTVVAYLPAGGPHAVPRTGIRAGTSVLVQVPGMPEAAAEAVVTRLGPAVEELPAMLWVDPTRPEFGRPVLIAGVSGLGLTPGGVALVRPLD